MIIMLNGAFGVGKTTLAQELVSKLPKALLYDPEEVGYMLRNIVTTEIKKVHEQTDNFQDMDLWRTITVHVAEQLKMTYQKDLIVPMTIYKKDYLRYIFESFKLIDNQTFHFCLIATEEIIHARLKQRGEVEGSWAFEKTKICNEAFQDNDFKEYINTELMNIEEMVIHIKSRIKSLI